MDRHLIYHPYKTHKYMTPLSIGLCALSFTWACIFINKHILLAVFMLFLCTVTLLCTKYLHSTANIVITFDATGLKISNGNQSTYQFVPWEGFQYAYYAKNYKGYRFLLLSPRTLKNKQIKKGILNGTTGKRIYQDCIVVIHLRSSQEISVIERMIAAKNLQITIC